MPSKRNGLYDFAIAMSQTKATGLDSRASAAKTLSKNQDNAFKSASRAIRHNLNTTNNQTMDPITRAEMRQFYNRQAKQARGRMIRKALGSVNG